MQTPFRIFSWKYPFLPALKDYIEHITQGRPSRALIITPNIRPFQYIEKLYAGKKGRQVLPGVMPFSQVTSLWRASAQSQPEAIANQLDVAHILRECVSEVSAADCQLAAKFDSMELFRFLPWAFRLGALLDELATQGLKPMDIIYPEGDVAPPAAELLSALGRIGAVWRRKLDELKWSTPGLESYLAIQDAASIPGQLASASGRIVVIAGFYALNGVEDALLRELWKDGAHVCLHTDPALVKGGEASWACREHKRWARRWRAECELVPSCGEPAESSHAYFAGYDTHSQLAEISRMLQADPERDDSTAIILPSPALLGPVLHHLPIKGVNVSMGYPLTRAPVYKLICDLFLLQLGRSPAGHYYWRDILRIFHQPHLAMLKSGAGDPGISLRPVLAAIEKDIRKGGKFVDLDAMLSSVVSGLAADSDPRAQLLALVRTALIDNFATLSSTRGLANALQALFDLFDEWGRQVLHAFPLDAEALARLQSNALPMLDNNLLAHADLPLDTLYEIFRELCENERIPFSAYPLEGLQVLGLLETRLLHFDRVFVLDATDDALPGGLSQDPLLPDSLRPVLGLPDSRSRQNIVAHNLARLCENASEVNFLWQEDTGKSGLFDARKSRSRFIEERLWREEKKLGHLIHKGDGILRTPEIRISVSPVQARNVSRSAAVSQAFSQLVARGVSATTLDVFVACPFRFAQQYLLRIAPSDEVEEGDNHALVGTCIHESLKIAYEPYLKRVVHKGELTVQKLLECFRFTANKLGIENMLPLPAWLMLEKALPARLSGYLEHQPDCVYVDELEHWLATTRLIAGAEVRLTGKLDRIDVRNGGCFILDYKTGNPRKADDRVWGNDEFFESLAAWKETGAGSTEALMAEVRETFKSLQLPFYVTLLPEEMRERFANAAFVNLGGNGSEVFLASDDADIAEVRRRCELLIDFVLRSMIDAEFFSPVRSPSCEWCNYGNLCVQYA